MEIEYAITVAEFTAFVKLRPLHEHVKGGRRFRNVAKQGLWVFVLCLILLWFYSSPNSAPFLPPFLAGAFVGAIGAMLLLVYLKRVAVASNHRFFADERNRWHFEPRRLRIDAQGLMVTSSQHEGTTKWAGICQIDQADYGVAFWDSTRTAHIVPRRAFRDQGHFEEFVALARRYKQGWREQEKPTGIITSLPPEPTAIRSPDAL